ncbi:MAG: hypothetical protein EXQ70_11290 [Solirubrobacterales bacterium]|nr:hypothetical protein [Solirubrobacterales bacterium]
MKLSKKSTAAICVVAAFVGGAAFAAISSGGEDKQLTVSADRNYDGVVPVERVDSPAAGAQGSALAQTAKKKAKGVTIQYFQEQALTTLNAGFERVATLPCPVKTKALGGYFHTTLPGAVQDYSGIGNLGGTGGPRLWSIGVANITNDVDIDGQGSTDIDTLLGVVCAKGVK